jgi:hypothetical protein
MYAIAVVLIMLASVFPFSVSGRGHHHHPIAREDEHHLMAQVRSVDISVLDNDSGPGPERLQVVAVTTTRGGRAEIIDGRTVRVTIDWDSYAVWLIRNTNARDARVAYGTYVISNGYARSVATWTISYWPEANT